MLNDYLMTLEAQRKSVSSIETRRIQLRAFLHWLQINELGTEPSQITSHIVTGYCSYLRTKGLKPTAINTHRASIYSYCEWLLQEGHIPYNPVVGVPREQVSIGDYRRLDGAQQFRLVRACLSAKNKKGALIVLVLLHTGVRVSEIVHLTPDDVIVSDSDGVLAVRTPSGTVARIVPLPKQIREPLANYVISCRALGAVLFEGQPGKSMTTRGVQLVCSKFGALANIPDLTPDALRHTHMYNLLEAGVPAARVATILGLSTIDLGRVNRVRA